MRKSIILLALCLSMASFAEDLTQLYEKACFLETAKGQTKEAGAIFQGISEAEQCRSILFPGGENVPNHELLSAAKRLKAIYNRNDDSSLAERLATFNAIPPIREHIIETFGEPLAYLQNERVLDKTALPSRYTMSYPNGFSIAVSGNTIHSFRFHQPIYQCRGVSVGSSREEVLTAFPPVETKELPEDMNQTGIYYTHPNCLCYSHTNIQFVFSQDNVHLMIVEDNTLNREEKPQKAIKPLKESLPTDTPPDKLALMFEKAIFLRTAKARDEESQLILQTIAATKRTDQTQAIIKKALEEIINYQSQHDTRTLQEKIDQFNMRPLQQHVIDTFGDPDQVIVTEGAANKMPGARKLVYNEGFRVSICDRYISQISLSIFKPIYHFKGLTIGATEKEVFGIYPPLEIHTAMQKEQLDIGHVYRTPRSTHFKATDELDFFFNAEGELSDISISVKNNKH